MNKSLPQRGHAMISRFKYIILGLTIIVAMVAHARLFSSDSTNADRINRGIGLMNEWGDWYLKNKNGLEYPRVRPNKKTLETFFQSIELSNKAVYIISNAKGFQNMTSDETEKVINYRSQALKYAKTINITELNSWYPKFGTIYQTKFVAGLTDFVNGLSAVKNNHSDSTPDQFPSLTVNELDVTSKILSKAMVKKLNEEDIENFKRMLKNYDMRTGMKMGEKDFGETIKLNKIICDYYYELGSSFLLSWDAKSKITSPNFSGALDRAKECGWRSPEEIKMDYIALDAASKNQTFFKNDKTGKNESGRDTILRKLKQNEIRKNNFDILMGLFKKYSVSK